MSSDKENKLFDEQTNLRSADYTGDSLVYTFANKSKLDQLNQEFREYIVENNKELNEVNQMIIGQNKQNDDEHLEIIRILNEQVESDNEYFKFVNKCIKKQIDRDYQFINDLMKIQDHIIFLWLISGAAFLLGVIGLIIGVMNI